jgi:hypothetical protein
VSTGDPREHKTAAIRYYCNKMKTYDLTPESILKARDNIRQTLLNNKYSHSSLEKFNRVKRTEQNNQRKKWAKLTYTGKETRFITNLFKNTNIKHKTRNYTKQI